MSCWLKSALFMSCYIACEARILTGIEESHLFVAPSQSAAQPLIDVLSAMTAAYPFTKIAEPGHIRDSLRVRWHCPY